MAAIGVAAAVEQAINDADPIGLLKGGAPADEYSPEIGTIVPKVVNAQSVDEIAVVWPSGKQQVVRGPIDINTTVVVREE